MINRASDSNVSQAYETGVDKKGITRMITEKEDEKPAHGRS